MKIISHRGFWTEFHEKNSEVAFKRSFENGFGLETDIRDYKGELVISHDIPEGGCLPFQRLLEIHRDLNSTLLLALNIKSDGLHGAIGELLKKYNVTNYFVFDMSVPDMLGYLKSNLTVFSRHSEYENKPVFFEQANGIWIDAFENEWWGEETIKFHLEAQKSVCIVSPELHHRNFQLTWNKLSSMSIIDDPNLMLCTDYPEHARKFFYGKN
jgi:glycerophosphoryl diester phosphodiesterase